MNKEVVFDDDGNVSYFDKELIDVIDKPEKLNEDQQYWKTLERQQSSDWDDTFDNDVFDDL